MNNLSTYLWNKSLSFLGVFACIALTYAFFGNTMYQWQAILLSIVIFGYGHFILGFYYQLRSFVKKPFAWQYFLTFGFLVLFSVLLSYIMFVYAGFAAALFVGFLYFLFHGLLNEQTLIKRQSGYFVPLLFLTALAIYVISLLTYSVPDETFFFDRQLQFQNFDSFFTVDYVFERYYLSLAYFTQVFWIGFSLSIATLLFAWLRHGFGKLTLALGSAMVGVTVLVATFGPPAYIYMYVFVVGYHFMTWLLFYIVEFKKRGSVQYRLFILQNILILLPFLVAAHLFFLKDTPSIVYFIFDYFFFVTATYVHISTSFMNDEWFQNLQHQTFRLIGFETVQPKVRE